MRSEGGGEKDLGIVRCEAIAITGIGIKSKNMVGSSLVTGVKDPKIDSTTVQFGQRVRVPFSDLAQAPTHTRPFVINMLAKERLTRGMKRLERGTVKREGVEGKFRWQGQGQVKIIIIGLRECLRVV